MKKTAIFSVVALVFQVSVMALGQPYHYVRLPAQLLTPAFIKSTHFVRDHKWDDYYAFGYLSDEAYQSLSEQRGSLVTLDAKAWAHEYYDAKTLMPVRREVSQVGPFEDYHTYATLTAELHQLANQYPDLVTLVSAGKSTERKDLWYVKLTASKKVDPNKPKLLYISSMHGDEVSSKEVMVYLIRELITKYGREDRLTALMDYSEIFIMPSMNPDGTENQSRFNSSGVDLNRDFPELSEEPFPSGKAPEVMALMELHRKFPFVLAMNFHGGSLCVNIPWDSKPNTSSDMYGDDAFISQLALHYAQANPHMYANTMGSFVHGVTYGYEWYQVLGGMQDWSIYNLPMTQTTLEMYDIKWPSSNQLPSIWGDNRESLLRYLEGGMTGIHLKVVDANGNPLPVSVDVSSAKRTLKYQGVVHRPTPEGAQEVTIQAPGFPRKVLQLSATRFSGDYETVVMSH